MTRLFSKRWLHPQTVPRGFLRLYIVTLLSRGPETGYSMMEKIEERTEGAWRPGPGTMYPLLKGLVADGLAKATGGGEARQRGTRSSHTTRRKLGAKTYVLTAKGGQELEEMRRALSGMGRKEPVMGRLFSDLLPGPVFVSMILRRFREGNEVFRQKLREIPEPGRATILKELQVLLESELEWINSQMESGGRKSKPAPIP